MLGDEKSDRLAGDDRGENEGYVAVGDGGVGEVDEESRIGARFKGMVSLDEGIYRLELSLE